MHGKLSQKIDELAHQCKGRREMTVQDVLNLTGPSEHSIVSLILSLPFALGVRMPWIGILFCLIIMWQGLRLALHKKIWLPKSIKRKKISGDYCAHILSKMVKFFKGLEKYVHPRGTVYQQHPLWLTFNGWMIALGGFYLILPFSNHMLPGLGVFLLALGLLEEDILWMISAYVALTVHAALLIKHFVF